MLLAVSQAEQKKTLGSLKASMLLAAIKLSSRKQQGLSKGESKMAGHTNQERKAFVIEDLATMRELMEKLEKELEAGDFDEAPETANKIRELAAMIEGYCPSS